jgi:sugar O-acyltransferase (sialic acid O-acetyltransferase NeuD family)
MNKKVIIFGTNDFAELAHFYLTTDSEYEVAGFCLSRDYLSDQTSFKGLPVFLYEDITKICPPSEYCFFAPMAPKKINQVRRDIYTQIKSLGYDFISYISSKATVLTKDIGENCFILEDNTIQPFVKVGNNVIMWSGNHIGHHSVIRDHVFFTSHVVLSGHCDVGEQSFFGVNSTIRDQVKISAGTLLAMSGVLISDTEDYSIYRGFPAKKLELSSRDADI